MQDNQMKKLAKQIVDSGFTAGRPLIPCDEADLIELEQRFKLKLPVAYKNFLRLMGRQAGDFLNDSSWRYPLELAHSGALSLLKDNKSSFELSQGAMVFLYRDNFFLFFDTEAGNDPPVRIFNDGSQEPEPFFDSFSEWFKACVDGEIAIRRDCVQLEKDQIDRARLEPFE